VIHKVIRPAWGGGGTFNRKGGDMARKKLVRPSVGDDGLGIFDDRQVYNQHAIARLLGLSLADGECSKFVLRKLLHAGVPFARVGRQYLISGKILNQWVQQQSKTWDEWQQLKEAAASRRRD
jgi:hypothetical protein